MRIAIVCDDLIQEGGAEKVFENVLDLYPDADIYTSVASKKWLKKLEDRGFTVHTSYLQKIPFSVKLNRFYALFLLHIFAFESFDFSKYDLVISMSSRFAHFIITKPTTKHVCYMHSPGRMFWDTLNYFSKESLFIGTLRRFTYIPLHLVRLIDLISTQRIDLFISNSKLTQSRIEHWYKRSSKVIYPGIDLSKFKVSEKEDYYLVLTRLIPWKRVDTAVEAFNNNKKKLVVVGTGPALNHLKKIALHNVTIKGYVSDAEKVQLLSKAKALINTQKEDFGLVPLEAQASGTPVIAYGKGGVLETVLVNKTGIFYKNQNVKDIEDCVIEFEKRTWDSIDCIEQSEHFSIEQFNRIFLETVNGVY